MPTYQYACTACGHQFEEVQSFSDSPLTDCPECEGRLRKVFSSVGIVFKGSGFYRTDSRSGSTANESANGGSTKSEASSGDSSTGATSSTESKSSSDSGSTATSKAKPSAPATTSS